MIFAKAVVWRIRRQNQELNESIKGVNLFNKNFRFQEKISSLLYSLVSGENKSRFDLSRSVMAESQNRQILQDLQQKRQMLLNQGQGVIG